MRLFKTIDTVRSIFLGTYGAAAIAAGAAFLAASPVLADGWHHHGGGGTNVFLGFGFYSPPPVYYYPPPPVYYYPPPVVYAPPPAVYAPPPAAPAPPTSAVQTQPTCNSGQWRQQDGSIVNGVACLQPNGTWQLSN